MEGLVMDAAPPAVEPVAARKLRFLFALPGFHSEDRGAEVALLSVAEEIARGGDSVLVIGTGPERAGSAYAYRRVGAINRRRFERLPSIPLFRSETAWEDATFAWNLCRAYRPDDFDVTVTCNYPFTHWALRRGGAGGAAPAHVFVTQNGDWPAFSDAAEFRFFHCDGLVCTNPDYRSRNAARWNTALVPNGTDPARFAGVEGDRAGFGLPRDTPVVLMVSAFIETKRVLAGMEAVAALPGAHFVVAGDGPLRDRVDALAREILPGRFTRLTLGADRMPVLYRPADAFLHMSLQEGDLELVGVLADLLLDDGGDLVGLDLHGRSSQKCRAARITGRRARAIERPTTPGSERADGPDPRWGRKRRPGPGRFPVRRDLRPMKGHLPKTDRLSDPAQRRPR
ncbi:glycosyltransferase [Leptolyngbya sp. 15MV]|nr:glycosyltransferase [Leptolyngbya sp. 15MV]